MSRPIPIARGEMREFDPAAELHFPLLVIKAVEPGCTTEIQIEDALTGEVTRLTTTDSAAADFKRFEAEVLLAWRRAWIGYVTPKGGR